MPLPVILLTASLIVVLLVASPPGGGGPTGASPGHGGVLGGTEPSRTRSTGLARAARRFVGAFLATPVRGADPKERSAIRRGASPGLSRQILSASHRTTRPDAAGEPRLTALRVVAIPDRQDLALVTGSARSPSGPEPFSFVFARGGGRWLAIAPGE